MYELAYTDCPASLVEIAYHDNLDDEQWIVNNMELIGITLAKSCLKYFGIAYVEPPKINMPQWKINGAKYLHDAGYTQDLHDPLEIVDIGLLGTVMWNRDSIK